MIRPLLLAASLVAALPAYARENAGAYLAGRAAQIENDFEATSRYLAEALQDDSLNPMMMETLVGAYISLLEMDAAEDVATDLTQAEVQSQIAALALFAVPAKARNWADILNEFDAGLTVAPLFDGVVRAFALLGDGRVEEALAQLQAVQNAPGTRAFGVYYSALALAQLGRFDEAATLLDEEDELRLTRRGVRAQAEILSNVGRNDDARAVLLEETSGNLDETLNAIAARLDAGETLPLTIAPDPQAAIAEIAFDIANTIVGETAPSYALLYTRIAEYLRPGHPEASLLSALLLEDMQQYDLAIETYGRVPTDDVTYVTAQLGRAEVMREAGRAEAGIDAIRALAEDFPNNALIHITLGDALREDGAYAEAEAAYNDAVALFEGDSAAQWIVYFARAIVRERQDDWDAAEDDFQKALELSPGRATVLNYLGYSLIERQERLDEALVMIQEAVAAAPNSGPIVDSLGWAFYRLGRYAEAVEPMERAVELMPVDPVVNDHLGDVLWAVGRELEARFQWQRALSFVENDENEEVDPDRIRRKLEVGLDAVLEEEGAPPLRMADGG
ncbi:lipoprotein NlpI [Rhodobacteraceae bacterium THAF1]|uniref:tetratricopeptide repeat protein n=1 Tax=Palleronia sp. THAF1 TaxID=2587842 RepID=UPI000F3D5F60|nr:tetratricopeptide repeat protein [Palleronia sp. THAF1]QFU09794.1 lipoprotein NlpI [Palleronia sp. THAF1]VDC17303.1 lipoprotein NlpI [Rhodobacteraceae bacterium THAF1]